MGFDLALPTNLMLARSVWTTYWRKEKNDIAAICLIHWREKSDY